MYLRPVCNIFSTLANEPDCFHASVRECSIACELGQAFDGILEWVDDSQEISFKDARCKHATWFSTHYHANSCCSWKEKFISQNNVNRNRSDIQMIFPVVWNASSTVPSSWSEAARRKTLNMFFQPERMLCAWEFTIWATQRTTISRIVGDLTKKNQYVKQHLHSLNCICSAAITIICACTSMVPFKQSKALNWQDLQRYGAVAQSTYRRSEGYSKQWCGKYSCTAYRQEARASHW